MKKLVNVVCLPTTAPIYGDNNLIFNTSNKQYFVATSNLAASWNGQDSSHLVNNHLYLTSSEEIKEGDWCIYIGRLGGKILTKAVYTTSGFVFQEQGVDYGFKEGGITPLKDEIFKVVVTTDPSLNLPLIPQSFVELFVEEKGNIKEILWDTETLKPTFGHIKKQTVEEAADKYASNERFDEQLHTLLEEAFLAGAKWAQKNK